MSPPAAVAVTSTTTTEFNEKVVNGKVPDEPKRGYPTLEELRSAVPKHCFDKNAFRSCLYLAKDYTQLGLMYLLVPSIEHYLGFAGLFAWWWVGVFAFL